MALQGLPRLFGAALAPLARDGVLHTTTTADDGLGGFTTTTVDVPAKVVVDSLSERDRVASGLPADTVMLTVFRAGLTAFPRIDDGITVDDVGYRIVGVTHGAGGVSIGVTAVPA